MNTPTVNPSFAGVTSALTPPDTDSSYGGRGRGMVHHSLHQQEYTTMTTTEEAIADEKMEKNRLTLIAEGWKECEADCGNIYEPGTVLIKIAGNEICESCIDDAGLVKLEDYRELLKALKDLRESVQDAYKFGRIEPYGYVVAGNVIAKAERIAR